MFVKKHDFRGGIGFIKHIFEDSSDLLLWDQGNKFRFTLRVVVTLTSKLGLTFRKRSNRNIEPYLCYTNKNSLFIDIGANIRSG